MVPQKERHLPGDRPGGKNNIFLRRPSPMEFVRELWVREEIGPHQELILGSVFTKFCA